MEPEQIITALLAVLGSSVAIEIIPIKINPWTWLARRIGKAILGDVTEQLSWISEQLKSHIEADARDKAKRLRVRILRFADELLQGERHSQEHFNEILEDITEYNRYCATHPDFPNDKAAISIGHIENVYRARLENNDFL